MFTKSIFEVSELLFSRKKPPVWESAVIKRNQEVYTATQLRAAARKISAPVSSLPPKAQPNFGPATAAAGVVVAVVAMAVVVRGGRWWWWPRENGRKTDTLV